MLTRRERIVLALNVIVALISAEMDSGFIADLYHNEYDDDEIERIEKEVTRQLAPLERKRNKYAEELTV